MLMDHKRILIVAVILITIVSGLIKIYYIDNYDVTLDEYGPNIGKGKVPKISPVNKASPNDLHVYNSSISVELDGVIELDEWYDAATIWFVLGDKVNTTGYFKHNSTHLLVAYNIPDATPEDMEKVRFMIDVDNDGGAVGELKADDLQFYLQRGDEENWNPNFDYSNYAWEVYRGSGREWLAQNRTMPFEFAVTNADKFWVVEMAIPLGTGYLDYQNEETKAYRSMSFVANAGKGQGSWPVDTFIIQPDSWGEFYIHQIEKPV
jgi:hypothetical protein